MGQLVQNIIYFNDGVGNILPGFKSFFYEAGTTTPKTVYSDQGLKTPIVQPVIADSAGVLPQIWLESGPYRWQGFDENDVQKFDRDNINSAESNVNSSSNFYFNNNLEMTQGILYNGESIDLQNGQVASTVYGVAPNDGLGSQYVIQATDSGGDILLNNGRYAHKTGNFATSSEIDSDIAAHDGLPLNSVHTNMMNSHNADVAAHAAAIDPKISTHNSSGTAHTDIRGLITTNTTDIGNNETDIEINQININKLRYVTFFVTTDGTIVSTISNQGSVTTVSSTKAGTGQYTVTFSDIMRKFSFVGIGTTAHEVVMTTSLTTNDITLSFNIYARGTTTLQDPTGLFHATVWYDEIL